MLEAAIVGRPVHTLLIPGFDAGQVGTMHFHYLVEAFGGLATVASDFAEHQRQLATVLQGAPTVSSRSRAFAEQFLRPRGAGEEVSPFLASEIESAASIRKTPAPDAPLWQSLLRRPLLTWMRRKVARPHARGRYVRHRDVDVAADCPNRARGDPAGFGPRFRRAVGRFCRPRAPVLDSVPALDRAHLRTAAGASHGAVVRRRARLVRTRWHTATSTRARCFRQTSSSAG